MWVYKERPLHHLYLCISKHKYCNVQKVQRHKKLRSGAVLLLSSS